MINHENGNCSFHIFNKLPTCCAILSSLSLPPYLLSCKNGKCRYFHCQFYRLKERRDLQMYWVKMQHKAPDLVCKLTQLRRPLITGPTASPMSYTDVLTLYLRLLQHPQIPLMLPKTASHHTDWWRYATEPDTIHTHTHTHTQAYTLATWSTT